MCRADPTQKRAVGTGVLYNHLTINDLQGVAAPTLHKNRPSARAYYITTRLSMSYKEGPRRPLPAIHQGERQHVTVGTLTITNNLSLQSPDGGAAMGGIAAHGYVNGKAGAARQG